MITHDGRSIPTDPIRWDPDGTEWVSMAWDAMVARHGSMDSSQWILPTGWTNEEERTDVSAQAIDGATYDHVNQVRLTASGVGSGRITNRVAFSDGTRLDRSVEIPVEHL